MPCFAENAKVADQWPKKKMLYDVVGVMVVISMPSGFLAVSLRGFRHVRQSLADRAVWCEYEMGLRDSISFYFYEGETCHAHSSTVGWNHFWGWYCRKGAGSVTVICPGTSLKEFAVPVDPTSSIWTLPSVENVGDFSEVARLPVFCVDPVSGDRHHGTMPDRWSAMARKCASCCSG